MPETRIALIMGGGVSLGSFSGGALAQVVKLLKHVKRGPAKIDVVSGASAGSMTLGVVVYHLLKGSSDEDIEKALEKAWVELISIENLYPKDILSHKQPSLFSNIIIEEIANEIIKTDRWPETADPHPLFAEGMKVSFSVTNLNGIPVRAEGQLIRQPESGKGDATGKYSVFADAVQTTFHQDNMRFVVRFNPDSEEEYEANARVLRPWKTQSDKESWEIFRNAAIASGAFPGAFPPGRISRKRNEFGEWWPDDLKNIPTFTFDYLDGGILRNEPLKEAIHMAADQDKGKDVERVFIFIDPNVSGTSEVYPLSFNQPLSLKEEYDENGRIKSMELQPLDYMSKLMGVFGRFAGVLASQATYRDWLKTARYNSLVEWRDQLMELFNEVQPKPGSEIEKNLDELLATIFEEKLLRSKGTPDSEIDSDIIENRIQEEIELRSDTDGTDAFTTKLKLAIDLVANLRDKRKINMVAITPSSIEGEGVHRIAGNFLRGFGGFFDENYRDYDYKVGKHIAANVLNAPIGDAQRFLKEAIEVPPPPPEIIPAPHYRELGKQKREQFEKLIEDHLDNILPIPGLIRRFARKKMVNSIRKSLLADTEGQVKSVYLRFENVMERRYLKGSSGVDNHVNDNGVIETVIGIRKRREGGISYEMFGPQLHVNENNEFYFQFFRNRRTPFRSGVKKGTIFVKGELEEWFKSAYSNSSPYLIRDMNDPEPYAQIHHADLKSDFLFATG